MKKKQTHARTHTNTHRRGGWRGARGTRTTGTCNVHTSARRERQTKFGYIGHGEFCVLYVWKTGFCVAQRFISALALCVCLYTLDSREQLRTPIEKTVCGNNWEGFGKSYLYTHVIHTQTHTHNTGAHSTLAPTHSFGAVACFCCVACFVSFVRSFARQKHLHQHEHQKLRRCCCDKLSTLVTFSNGARFPFAPQPCRYQAAKPRARSSLSLALDFLFPVCSICSVSLPLY